MSLKKHYEAVLPSFYHFKIWRHNLKFNANCKNYYHTFRRNLVVFLSILVFFSYNAQSFANSKKPSKNADLQAQFLDWSIFKSKRGDDFVCYMISLPIRKTGNYLNRGEPYFIVTNLPNDADEITISSGFIYKETVDVELSFGSRKFYLFPYSNLAWANDKNDDIDIIKEMQKAPEATISATAIDGTNASDIYSFIGFSQAYSKLKEICK